MGQSKAATYLAVMIGGSSQETIVSTEPGQFTVKSLPATEVLSFAVPAGPKFQRFDEITVIFLPDTERPNRGAKVAIKQFDLIPR
jgi:hypothetical protein